MPQSNSLIRLCSFLFAFLIAASALAAEPIRVAVVGLHHGHAYGIFNALKDNTDVKLVAVVESDKELSQKYATRYQLADNLFYTDLETALNRTKPAAVLVYTSIHDHRKVIEAAAAHGIPSMVEKPLATTLQDAIAIRKAAREHHVNVLVNYETTWYASNTDVINQVKAGKLGDVRKVVVHDGHEGPKEIGVGPEFLSWLTDPVLNGAGAMFDFGCYGADLVTLMMNGETPVSVTAVAQTDKPDVYPKVDDDATIIIRYPKAQAVLMPSWNWPFSRKDMEVYGSTGYAIATDSKNLRLRYKGEKEEHTAVAPALPSNESSSLNYLVAVMRGEIKPAGDLNSLDTNMIVVQILDAARESAKTGKTVMLKPLAE